MLVVRRELRESWRDCVTRYAARHGMEDEAISAFDAELARGTSENHAAWNALYEWDLLDFQDSD